MFKLLHSAKLKNEIQCLARRNLSFCGISCGNHKMPERLKKIGESDDPNFFEMVEYHFHQAVTLMEDSFIKELKKYPKMTEEDRIKRVKGIIGVMSNCQTVIELNFPIRKDNGEYEIITGYRAHHNTHR